MRLEQIVRNNLSGIWTQYCNMSLKGEFVVSFYYYRNAERTNNRVKDVITLSFSDVLQIVIILLRYKLFYIEIQSV